MGEFSEKGVTISVRRKHLDKCHRLYDNFQKCHVRLVIISCRFGFPSVFSGRLISRPRDNAAASQMSSTSCLKIVTGLRSGLDSGDTLRLRSDVDEVFAIVHTCWTGGLPS